MKFFDSILDLLFPPKCPFCGKLLDQTGICGSCEKTLPWTGEACRRTLPDDLVCAAPLWYKDQAREGILRFKFQGNAAAAEPLGRLIAQCAAEEFSGGFDTVTWVPVSRQRLRQRGYDQAELLARSACRQWDTRPVRLLRKLRDNPAQSGLEGAAARLANVRDVYAAEDGAAGRRILLIDDICTTGATLCACARALRAAGAVEVLCAAALTPREISGGDGEKGQE